MNKYNNTSNYSFYHENIAIFPDPPDQLNNYQMAEKAKKIINTLTTPSIILLPKKVVDRLSSKLQNLTLNPTISAYKHAGQALLEKFNLNDFVMILVLADSESEFNPSAINETARGMLQLQLSNLVRLTDEFISNKRKLVPLLGKFYSRFLSHDIPELKALIKGGINFKNQALHPIIQAIPGIMLYKKNLNTLETYFERFEDEGWQPRGTVLNQAMCRYIIEHPEIFKALDPYLGKQALMTIIHINGQPWLLKPNKPMSHDARPSQDAKKYLAFRDQLSSVVTKLYKTI